MDASKRAAAEREKKLGIENKICGVALPASVAAIGSGIGYGAEIGGFLGPFGIIIGAVVGAAIGTICAIKIIDDNDKTYRGEIASGKL